MQTVYNKNKIYQIVFNSSYLVKLNPMRFSYIITFKTDKYLNRDISFTNSKPSMCSFLPVMLKLISMQKWVKEIIIKIVNLLPYIQIQFKIH